MESYKELDIHQAKEMMDKEDVIIVDIRDPNSYQEAHIPNAILIDQSTIDQFTQDSDKNKPLICYCYLGESSQMAAQYLKDQGFQSVYNIIGGFNKWQQTYPTTSKDE